MNLRHRAPKQNDTDFLRVFRIFSVLFSPKTVLSSALSSTVSTQSEAVDGQNCGQARLGEISDALLFCTYQGK